MKLKKLIASACAVISLFSNSFNFDHTQAVEQGLNRVLLIGERSCDDSTNSLPVGSTELAYAMRDAGFPFKDTGRQKTLDHTEPLDMCQSMIGAGGSLPSVWLCEPTSLCPSWFTTCEKYISDRKLKFVCACVLLDMSSSPETNEIRAENILARLKAIEHTGPIVFVGTKYDISRETPELNGCKLTTKDDLDELCSNFKRKNSHGFGNKIYPETVATSAKDKTGIDELKAVLHKVCYEKTEWDKPVEDEVDLEIKPTPVTEVPKTEDKRDEKKKGLSTGAKVGLAIGGVAVLGGAALAVKKLIDNRA